MKQNRKSMNNDRKIYILLILAFLPSIVNANSPLILRPQVGYGYIDSLDSKNSGNLSHIGMRLLLNTDGNKRYGLETTKLNLGSRKSFYSLGIVLEQRLWNWFNMSIGTVGYFNYTTRSDNPVGLMTNLGWEPDNNNILKPFITYRNDVIFAENIDIVHSLSVGLSFEF